MVQTLSVTKSDIPYIGVKVEELRRGKRWISIPSHKLVKRTPPLLIVYSIDHAIMDLDSVSLEAFNYTTYGYNGRIFNPKLNLPFVYNKKTKSHRRRIPRDTSAISEDTEG